MTRRIVAVGAVLTDDEGRVLLIKRRNPPQAGKWTIPGGKVEPGESIEAAVVREMVEETGFRVEVGGSCCGPSTSPGPDDVVFEVHDFAARIVSGTLCAGDDAADAGWFTADELAELPVTRGTDHTPPQARGAGVGNVAQLWTEPTASIPSEVIFMASDVVRGGDLSVEVNPDSLRAASGTLAQLSADIDSAPFLGAAEVSAQLPGSSVGGVLSVSRMWRVRVPSGSSKRGTTNVQAFCPCRRRRMSTLMRKRPCASRAYPISTPAVDGSCLWSHRARCWVGRSTACETCPLEPRRLPTRWSERRKPCETPFMSWPGEGDARTAAEDRAEREREQIAEVAAAYDALSSTTAGTLAAMSHPISEIRSIIQNYVVPPVALSDSWVVDGVDDWNSEAGHQLSRLGGFGFDARRCRRDLGGARIAEANQTLSTMAPEETLASALAVIEDSKRQSSRADPRSVTRVCGSIRTDIWARPFEFGRLEDRRSTESAKFRSQVSGCRTCNQSGAHRAGPGAGRRPRGFLHTCSRSVQRSGLRPR